MPTKTKTVRCPRCAGASIWDETNRFRPFCSERCKTGDLGAWASDEYRIAGSVLEDALSSDQPLPLKN